MNIKYMWLDRKYLIGRQVSDLQWKLAGKLPKTIQSKVFYLIVGKATSGKYGNTNPADLTVFEAINRWNEIEKYDDKKDAM